MKWVVGVPLGWLCRAIFVSFLIFFLFYFGVKFLCWIDFFRLWFEPSLMIYKTFVSVLHWNTYVSIMKFML